MTIASTLKGDQSASGWRWSPSSSAYYYAAEREREREGDKSRGENNFFLKGKNKCVNSNALVHKHSCCDVCNWLLFFLKEQIIIYDYYFKSSKIDDTSFSLSRLNVIRRLI